MTEEIVPGQDTATLALNKFRIDTPLDEFIDWCRKVADHAVQKPKEG